MSRKSLQFQCQTIASIPPGRWMGFPWGPSLPCWGAGGASCHPSWSSVSVCPCQGTRVGPALFILTPLCARVTAGATSTGCWWQPRPLGVHPVLCEEDLQIPACTAGSPGPAPHTPLCVPAQSCSPTCLPHETFPQQDAEKCLQVAF